MAESQVLDLAMFGKRYRSLFVIGEYECSDKPTADRLYLRGRLLLTDFVSEFFEIRKITKEAAAAILDLKMQAYREFRIIVNVSEACHFARNIANKLRQVLDKLKSDGVKKLTDLEKKILEYRDEIVAPEVKALEAKVRGLERNNRSRGPIAALVNSFTLKLSFSERKLEAPSEKADDLSIAKSDLGAAKEISTKAAQTRTNMHFCTVDWGELHSTIASDKFLEINGLLTAEITPQSRGSIDQEFQGILQVLQILTEQMDGVYEDIETRFGLDGDINSRVEAFQQSLPHISCILNQLSSSQSIVDKSEQKHFLEEVQNLAKHSLAQLCRIEYVFSRWVIYTRSNSTGSLPFIDDAHKMSTKTTEFFERNWHASVLRLRAALQSGKKRPSMKGRNSDGDVNPSPREALRALDDLEESFFAITGFSIRFAMDLMFYDRRSQDDSDPERLSQLLVDPFAVDQDISEKAHEVLRDEISRLQKIAGPDSH